MLKELEQISESYENLFGITEDCFVIRENLSPETIETGNGVAVDDEKTRTCYLCVALNKTVFKNNNKPEFFHPHCKCKNKKYNLTSPTLDFPMEKITKYLFVNEDKSAMMRAMGYYPQHAQKLYNLIYQTVEQKFISGDYILKYLNEHGQHIEFKIIINGKTDHIGEKFKCHIGCTAWPYGKIKVATPLVDD